MKRFTLRVAISTLVSGLILASLVSIVAALGFAMRRALSLTAFEMMGQISHSMGDKVATRLGGVERLNVLIADTIHSGRIDLARGEASAEFLRDVLAANPAITLIDCGLPSGDKYQALRMPDGSISMRLVRRTAQGVVSRWRHANPAYAATLPDRVESLGEGYDPRVRPWYQAGTQAGKMVWTDLYPSRGGLNYSNVNPVFDGSGRLLCVTAIDMRLEDLSQFLSEFQVGRTGKAFILDRAGRLVALSGTGSDLDGLVKRSGAGFSLREPGEIQDGALRHAVLRYLRTPGMHGRGYLAVRDPQGRRILATFEAEPRYRFTFGALVPEKEILGPIKRSLQAALGLALVCLAASLAAAHAISRAISRPLAALAREVDRIRTLDLAEVPPIPTRIVEVERIDASVQNMRKGLRSFRKYVPADLVSRLLHLEKEAVIEGERRELTLFFSDIQDFTRISEQLSPEELTARLGVYFEAVTRALLEASGTVDKFIGDAVMAFWGAPTPLPGHAALACAAALRAQARIRALNEGQGEFAFTTRMGIHTGEALVGNIGFEGRMNYTVIGDNVNLASRLEGLNKFYGTRILVSGATLAAAGDAVVARIVDRVAVKGRARGVEIHELLALREEAGPGDLALAARAAEAFGHYLAGRWDEALALLEGDTQDGPSRVLAARCRQFREEPPGPGWDGVHHHQEK
jgi:adenylate cyclase